MTKKMTKQQKILIIWTLRIERAMAQMLTDTFIFKNLEGSELSKHFQPCEPNTMHKRGGNTSLLFIIMVKTHQIS